MLTLNAIKNVREQALVIIFLMKTPFSHCILLGLRINLGLYIMKYFFFTFIDGYFACHISLHCSG